MNTQISTFPVGASSFSLATSDAPPAWSGLGLMSAGKTVFRAPQRRIRPDVTRHSLAVLVCGRLRWHSAQASGTLTAGEGLLMPAGIAVEREYDSQKTEQLWFVFPDNSRWRGLRGGEPVMGRSFQAGELDWVLRELYGWSLRAKSVRDVRIGNGVVELLGAYLEHDLRNLAGRRNPVDLRLETLMSAVAERPDRDWSTRALCRMTGLSPAGLHAFTLRTAGRAPLQLVTQLRMEHAKTLLQESDRTVEQIADAVGYGTAYAFSHAFLRWCGCRPGAYRKQRCAW